MVDRLDRSESAARLALLVRPGGRICGRSECARELDRGRADPAGAAVDQHPLARPEAAAVEQVRPDGEVGLRDRGCGRRVHAGWHRQALPRRSRAVLGVPAAGDQRADAVPGPPSPARRRFRHRSGHLEAGQVGRPGRRRILPQPLHQIGAVHARRFDLDQDFVRLQLRHGAVDGLQHVGRPGAEISMASMSSPAYVARQISDRLNAGACRPATSGRTRPPPPPAPQRSSETDPAEAARHRARR